MVELVFFVVLLAGTLALGMYKAPLWGWAGALAVAALIWQSDAVHGHTGVFGILLWLFVAGLIALSIPSLRRRYVAAPVFKFVKGTLPKVSDTEQQALEAGTVGFDAELFSGTPDWNKLRAIAPVVLTPEEQAFLDGPTEQLCGLIKDWQVRHQQREIPEEIWDFVKSRGFLGMLISKEHGGLGFSAQAQSLIIGKIASRSPDVVTIVMVPNSLGPGELIEKYGTEQQKHYYLPRLARGDEIPCFALTGPTSGSDAATMRDIGTVVRGPDGKPAIQLSWDKRYITLGPKATLLGLAFRLFDPDNLLGKGETLGITVAHDSDEPSRCADRPPPPAVRRRLPQRSQLGPQRRHPHGLGDRRRGHGRPRLAHAHGMPGCRACHLVALDRRRPAPRLCCASPPPTRASAASSACRWRAWRASRSPWRA